MRNKNETRHVTLVELKDERRAAAGRLLKADATLSDAKKFRSLCGEILYLQETLEMAKRWNAGKISDNDVVYPPDSD